MKADLKFCIIKLDLYVVFMEKSFILIASFRFLSTLQMFNWSVFSSKGTGLLYVVKDIMRQDKYKKVLERG